LRNFFILNVLLLVSVSQAFAQNVSLSVDASINGGNPPVAGTVATYDITVSNEGPGDALNVQLASAVPAGTTLQSFSPPAGWSCTTPPVGGTGAITCSTATFVPGFVAFTLVVNVPRATAQGTIVTLDATVSTTSPDPDTDDNTVSRSAPVIWQSLLGITKSAPATAVAGTSMTWTIDITNAGPSDAADVVLNDPLPAAFLFDSINAPGWSCTTPAAGSSGTVNCTIAQFGTSGTITIQGHTASSAAAQTLTNSADLSASSEPNTHSASASTDITRSADITLSKSSSALVAGTDVTYTISVVNNGPNDASDVTFADPLPAGLTFQSLNAPGWSCATPAVGGTGTIDCTLATLAPGSSTITLIAHLAASTPAGTTIANTATVSSTTPDPTTPNSATSSGTTTQQAGLAVTITDSPDPVTVGGPQLIYSIVVTNNGPSDAASPSLSIALPPTVTLASINAPAGWSCASLTCTAASLAPGTAAFTVTVDVLPSTPGGSTISTTATIASATATAVTTVLSPSNVTATKQANGPFFETMAFTWTVTLTNSGPGTQGDNPGDELTDQLPSSVILTGASATSGTTTADIPNNRVHWNGSIPAGGSVTITIEARVNAIAGTPISNQASIFSDADGNGTNETTGTSGTATFAPATAARIPTLSPLALIALALGLAFIALRR
jgi:uncharacterized repeat protein (TIGR01451 family)